jgi:hypothetical protein
MKRFFEREAESELGVGRIYLEFDDGWPSRQVEVYGNTWRWGDRNHPQFLADQPLDVLELQAEHAISAADFEAAWRRATRGPV